MSLNGHVVRLAKGVNLATVVTLMPDGGRSTPGWTPTASTCSSTPCPTSSATRTSSATPRITVLIPGDHPWDYAEVRGHVVDTVGGQEALDHIDFLARKYLGADSYPNPIGPNGRVILKIAADKVNARAGEDQRLTAQNRPSDQPHSTPE
jgi:hypothetical protein